MDICLSWTRRDVANGCCAVGFALAQTASTREGDRRPGRVSVLGWTTARRAVYVQSLVHDIVINGEPRRVAEGSTVASVLEELQLDSGQVAVERNREIVPKANYPTTQLATDDVLEIVTFVGGG